MKESLGQDKALKDTYKDSENFRKVQTSNLRGTSNLVNSNKFQVILDNEKCLVSSNSSKTFHRLNFPKWHDHFSNLCN